MKESFKMNLFGLLDKDLEVDGLDKKAENTHKEIIGLTQSQAEKSREKHGKNQITRAKKINPIVIFFAQYKDIMTVILIVCTLISIFMGEFLEAISIAVIVLMNGIMGFVQEFKTEKTLEALQQMAAPTANVYRNGVITKIKAEDIVVGDVLLIQSGDKIPADGTLIESSTLECDESMLTGESIPVKKNSIDDDSSKVYMGCVVTKGHATVKVTTVGMNTQMGKIASMLSTIKEEATPLQKKLGELSKYIAAGCLIICAVVSVTGMLRGEDFFKMLITGVSLAVAAVPEGLPAIVTISLALSVSRMVKRNALVRRLHAVETLGCATVICSDKTGTLTQNKMTATNIYIPSLGHLDARKLNKDDKPVSLLLTCAVACNNAVIGKDGQSDFGGHTETSLLHLGKNYGFTKESIDKKYTRLDENPFDSERKMMSVLVEDETHQKYLFVKGAFDILLQKCSEYQTADGISVLTSPDKARFVKESEKMADAALRVIGIAYKKVTPMNTKEENALVFLGLVGMIDPPRKEVKSAVANCKKAGIKPVMITGDHKKTAVAIAKEVGIYKDGDLVLTGKELDRMSTEELRKTVKNVSVFARVSPNHKLMIVRALKQNHQIVAMTGDGVNDAPAIKEADIGVSMGENGSDVTKESSEIVLLDDNFATLVGAVEEGRSIYNNIRKFIRYLLSCNIGEVMTMFIGMLMGMPVILFPIQILLVNLVTDGLPAIALGLEPSESDSMSRPPRKPGESIFSHGLAGKIIFRGMLIGIFTLATFVTLFKSSHSVDVARTGAFFALIFAQLLHVFECKSEDKNILHIPYFNNMKLILAALFSLTTILCAIYVPFMQKIFYTVPLTARQIAVPIGYCFIAPIASIFVHRNKKT